MHIFICNGINIISPPILPVHNLVDDPVLFTAAAPEIDPGGLNALVAQKIGEQGNVPAFLYEIFCKPVPEAVGIHDLRVQAVAYGENLELGSDAGGRDGRAETVEKQRANRAAGSRKPLLEFAFQNSGNIDTPHFISFRVNILVPSVDVFYLECDQFTDPDPGGSDEPHNEIIGVLLVFHQLPLQVFIITLADDLVQVGFLLYLDHGNRGDGCLPVFHKTVQGPDPQVDGLGLIMFQEIHLVELQVSGGELRIEMVDLFHCIALNTDRVRGLVPCDQVLLKLVQGMVWL